MGKKNRREVVAEEELEAQELDKELAAVMAMRQEQQLSEDDEEKETEEEARERKLSVYNKAAMEQKLDEITRDLPWIETLTTCEFPLNLEPKEVHDDLKREVAFYENAMQAVSLSIDRFNHLGLPFHRPQDFFAEMMKSDEHMARVSDVCCAAWCSRSVF
jgi:rRNA-processing protein EBP2